MTWLCFIVQKHNEKKVELNSCSARSRCVFSEWVACLAYQCHWPAELESPPRVNSFILAPWHEPHPKKQHTTTWKFLLRCSEMRIGRAVNMFRPVFASAGIQHMHKPQTQGLDVLRCSSTLNSGTPPHHRKKGGLWGWACSGMQEECLADLYPFLREQKASKVHIPLCNSDVRILRAGS